MAEINNALAAQIQVPQTNPLDTLGKLTAIQRGRQELEHNQFLYDRGGGYTPSELQTQAATQQQHLENASRIGNVLANDPSEAGRRQALQMAKDYGVPVNPLMEHHIMTAPAATIRQYGRNMQQAGQTAQSAIEQTGAPSYNRAYGTKSGELGGALAPADGGAPGAPASGPATGAPGKPPAPAGGLSLTERTREAEGNAQKRVEEFEGYRKENDAAGVQKVALRQLMDDADRVRTGAGADKEQAARKWLLAAGQLIPGLQGVADKFSDPVAAFESINKNAGLIARSAIKSVGGTAASELDAISKSLVGTDTSNKGIKINASQLVGLETYKQARFQAAQQYQDANGTLKGFAADFNKRAGPAAWVYMSLPPEERAKVAESLRKSSPGTLNSIAKQLKYIHENKLDEGVE
jgi:hypothetical protein